MKWNLGMNLAKLLNKDLRALRDAVDIAIKERQAADKARLRDEFRQMAFEAGTTLDEIVSSKTSRVAQAKKGARAMRDPETGVTWAGRGRMPSNFDRSRAVAV